MTTSHPPDRTLAALVDGALDAQAARATRTHLSECARCQLRIGSAGTEAFSLPMPADPDIDVPLAAAEVVLPERGDIWRLAWDETTILVVVWRPDDERVWVAPVVETADADEWCALLPRQVTGGLGELAVSVAHETAVPWSVLDARIGRLSALDSLESLRTAFRSGTGTSSDRGEPILSPLDDRLPGLDAIAEELSMLANARWAPTPAQEAEVSFDFDQLVDAGLPVNRALALTNRGGTPTDEEAAQIEAATGIRPPAAPVDDNLRRLIDQPRRKRAIRERARSRRQDEATVRLLLARSAQPELAAARGTAHGAAPDYDTILDRLLDD